MNRTIGALIKAYRKEVGLTQIDMAKIMRTSQSQICKCEKGILTPSLAQFARWYRDTNRQEVTWQFRLAKWLREGKLC